MYVLQQFEECNGTVNPTLGIELGKTIRFLQEGQTNWMHPLGFAYFPDGAHEEVDELEPGIPPPGAADQSCADDNSCPAPMYFVGGEYVVSSKERASFSTLLPTPCIQGFDCSRPAFSASILAGYVQQQSDHRRHAR